jgi:hypothetical protein
MTTSPALGLALTRAILTQSPLDRLVLTRGMTEGESEVAVALVAGFVVLLKLIEPDTARLADVIDQTLRTYPQLGYEAR